MSCFFGLFIQTCLRRISNKFTKEAMLQAVKNDMMCDLYPRTLSSLKHFVVLTFYI